MIRSLIFFLVLSTSASAGIINNAELDMVSRYVWRGIPYSSGLVAQPYIGGSLGDLKVGLWANHDFNPAGPDSLNEVDLYLSTSRTWGALTFAPLLQFYNYPQGANNTGELTLRVSCPLGGFSVYAIQNIDIIKYGGSNYTELGLAYTIEPREGISATLQANAGWGSQKFNETYLSTSKSTLNLLAADLGLSYYLNDSVYVRPHIYYSSIQDPDLRQALSSPDLICGGVALGGEF